MTGLFDFERREVPSWCFITERGSLETPYHNRILIPRDAYRCLDLYWDGLLCRASYYTWDYGVVYRYQGRSLPMASDLWRFERYRPPVELEVQVVNLAARGIEFATLESVVRRPRMEIAAIMNQHGYNGHACSIHLGVSTRLLELQSEAS